MTPFIPGANYKPDLPDHLKNLTPEEAIENANAQSKQRAIERSIRKSKELLRVANKLEDEDLINKYKGQVKSRQAVMRSYLAQHPFLHRDYSRERYYSDPLSEAKTEIKLRKRQNKKQTVSN